MSRKLKIEDFIKDPEFIKWVKNPDFETTQYWESYTRANPECKPAMDKAKDLIRITKFNIPLSPNQEKQEVLENILQETNNGRYNKKKSNRYRHIYYKIAATFALLITLGYLLQSITLNDETFSETSNEVVVKETPIGLKMQTILPDGTKVWLNALSQIRFTENIDNHTRIVELTGEAFFDVHKDESRPFVVYCGDIAVMALGTSFNVKKFDNDSNIEVALLTGKVSVFKQNDEQNSVVLHPGEKANCVIHSNSIVKSLFDVKKEIGWKDGYLVFENAEFDEIKSQLERWYGVEIIANETATTGWEYTGEFENQSLELVLQRLSFIKKLDFKIDGKKVYITKN